MQIISKVIITLTNKSRKKFLRIVGEEEFNEWIDLGMVWDKVHYSDEEILN